MKHVDSDSFKRYGGASLERARELLRQKDAADPLWMTPKRPSFQPWWGRLGDDFFQQCLVPAVCCAVIVCLLISAATTRMTVKALSLTVQSDLQNEIIVLDR